MLYAVLSDTSTLTFVLTNMFQDRILSICSVFECLVELGLERW